jgi:Kelch motif/Galactose oxidase, central domain
VTNVRLVAALVAVGLGGVAAALLAWSDDAGAEWERGASMSQRRSYIAAAEHGGHLYAAGGMVGETGRPLATFARYDTRTDRWEVLPALPVPTRAAAAASLVGLIYVVGGTTEEGNTTATWVYHPGERTWSRRAPLPEPLFNHGAVELNRRLFVLGGFSEGRERRGVYAYEPSADRWRRVTELPRANHAFGVVAYEDELWVIGGRRGEDVLREVWILDPATLEWRRGPALPKPMELLGATVAGDEIHAVWESTYQVYDGSSGTWRERPSPPVTRHALEAFAVDGVLYTVGGCTTALQDSPVVERLRLR